MVQLLLDRGADLSKADNIGRTALTHVSDSIRVETFELLLVKNAESLILACDTKFLNSNVTNKLP